VFLEGKEREGKVRKGEGIEGKGRDSKGSREGMGRTGKGSGRNGTGKGREGCESASGVQEIQDVVLASDGGKACSLTITCKTVLLSSDTKYQIVSVMNSYEKDLASW